MRLQEFALTSFILAAAIPGSVRGHGNMNWPPVWQDRNATWGLTKYSVFRIGNEYYFYNDTQKTGNIMMWYSNKVVIPDDVEPTLPVSLK